MATGTRYILPTRRQFLSGATGTLAAFGAGVAEAAAPAPFRLVMLGDSLTAGLGLLRNESIPARLQTALGALGVSARVVNAGASGETSADVRARLAFSVPDGTDGVLIAVGGNDMLQGLPPRSLDTNLRAMLQALKARRFRAAVAGMRASVNLGAAYRREFDAVYPAAARAFGAPLYPFLLEGVALSPALNQADGIHPNARGAALIAHRLAPFVVNAFGLSPARRTR